MLADRWEAGPKPYDGIWASWWYGGVHNSTGFDPPRKYPAQFPVSFYDLLEQSMPFCNLLKHKVKRVPPKPSTDLPVPTNEKLRAWVSDEILPHESAKVSVFDSVVQGGELVWEGLHIYKGKV